MEAYISSIKALNAIIIIIVIIIIIKITQYTTSTVLILIFALNYLNDERISCSVCNLYSSFKQNLLYCVCAVITLQKTLLYVRLVFYGHHIFMLMLLVTFITIIYIYIVMCKYTIKNEITPQNKSL